MNPDFGWWLSGFFIGIGIAGIPWSLRLIRSVAQNDRYGADDAR